MYRESPVPSVLQYYGQNGLSTKTPKYALLLGAIMPVVIGVFVYSMTHSADAHRAIALERAKSGPDFRYWVSGISYAGEHGSARIYAYNRTEIKDVGVKW
jgi:hypothetical protein